MRYRRRRPARDLVAMLIFFGSMGGIIVYGLTVLWR
jgi:hypothetical protein